MQPSINPQNINFEDSEEKHKHNYQQYLNNIYQTIKEKQFFVHRSQTPIIEVPNNHNVSILSGRSDKINKNQVLQSLPKLAVKDLISNKVFEIALANDKKEIFDKNKDNNNITKSANTTNRSNINKQQKTVSSNKIYQFSNFPSPKPSNALLNIYAPNILRQSRQLKDKKQIKDKKQSLSNKPQRTRTAKAQLQRINKDNMNLLGLNVEKVNYCEKKDNKKFMYVKVSKIDQDCQGNQLNRNNNEMLYMNNVVLDATIDKNNNENESAFLDMQLCEMLINQKMQIGKKYLAKGRFSKNSSVFSPNKIRTRISSSDKKHNIISNINGEQQLNPIYQSRYKRYLDFILKVSFSHKIYGQMDQQIVPENHLSIRNDKKYKAWIGNGNNGNLLKALIKRRFWWQIVEEKSYNVNFLWTQLKNNDYYKMQQKINKNKQKFTKTTQLDESTNQSLSVDEDQKNQKKSCSFRSSRVQSSLPGSIVDKKKMNSSPVKKVRLPFSQQESKNLNKIFNDNQIQLYKKISLRLQNKTFTEKLQILKIQKIDPFESHVHNHLMNNFYLGNKKALFYNLKEYYDLSNGDLFKTVPLTFHIKKGTKDIQYKRFLAYYKKRQTYIKKQEKEMQKQDFEEKRKMRNIWIVKPGENTNRGNGITVIDQIYEFNSILKSQGTHQDGSQKTFIVQLYIDRPLLYKKRKFDIRHYMLITHINGVMKGYWFEEGYIRTSGYEFNIQEFEREIHLTNDAVQKYTANYGRYQSGNKISYAEFQKYLDATYPKKNYSFYGQILPRMKEICLDSIKSSFLKLSPEKLEHNFQLFGMDFMIDSDFVPWLIEINTNPCLEITCALQARLLPQVVDETLRLTLDVIYPPPCHYPNTYRHLVPETNLQNMKYELIFDERIHGDQVRKLYEKNKNSNLLEEIGQLQDDQVYEDQGQVMKVDEVLQ